MSFVELHARSAFSFLRGASRPEDMMTRAAELGLEQMAVTDRDGVYGSARAHYRAKELGMKALIGAELTLPDESVLPVLVRTRTGYQNLCRLLTRSKMRAPKGESRVEWTDLEEFSQGLLALTGDQEGPLHRVLMNKTLAPRVLERLTDIFGRRHVAVELHRHRLRHHQPREAALLELAERFSLPVVASNAPCYAKAEGRMLLDAFTCLRHHTTLDEAGTWLSPNAQRRIKSEAEMRGLFADLPQAVDATARIAEQLEFNLEKLGYHFPAYPVPAGHDQSSFLRELAFSGARERYPAVAQHIRDMLHFELGIISELNFDGYFLIVWDIVRWCREQGIMVQGRGSAANSVVCYALGITNADPIKYKLLFERFLSQGRTSWPDIDLDLPSGDARESVIQEMYRRYAPYGAAMTANVITYRGRSAMREMSKVLGLPPDITNRFSSLYAHGDYTHTLELHDQIAQAGLPAQHPRLPALIKLYDMAYGLPRHLGQHSGGMVLCSGGLDSIVPLEPASMPNRTVVQWDKDDCEDLGIIKVDLLGLGMMAVLEETQELSRARGRGFEMHKIPPEDPDTYAMIQKADTIGLFQIESRAQQATLPRLKPKEFYDLVVEVAIIRPGPIVGNMVHPYLRRHAGREKPDYMHPDLKPVLERTLGVPLFQEQLLKIAMVMADFSGSEAEELRRALSFHRSEERMNKVVIKLREAMARKGVAQEVQDKIVSSVRSFAVYGFPESHAISFALLAYTSAWLRVHRKPEFTCALLNNQPMGFYSPSTLVRDAKLHGLRVLPVCVVKSETRCSVVDDHCIRLGLNQLNGVRQDTLQRLVDERNHHPWRDMNDFLARCPMSKKERRILAKAGALNALGEHHRREALWTVEKEWHQDLLEPEERRVQDSPLLMMNAAERLQADYQTTSVTVGPHPIALIRHHLPTISRAVDLPQRRHGELVKIAGLVICRQRPGTAKGHVFVSLEDETGVSNAFVPSPLFEKQRLVITQESFLEIHGRLQIVDDVITVCAQHVLPLIFESSIASTSHDFH